MQNSKIPTFLGGIDIEVNRRLQIPDRSFLMFGLFILILLGARVSMANQGSAETVEQKDAGCLLVILGASYAGSWNIDDIGGCRVVNSGVGGNTTVQMLDRFEADVSKHQPDYVLIWGFINDVSRSDPAELGETKDVVKDNLLRILEKTAAINAKPILVTEITLGFPAGFVNKLVQWKNQLLGKTTYQAHVNQHVMEVNQWLTELALGRKIPLLDFQRTLSDENDYRLDCYVQEDGSHVNLQGYDALTSYVARERESGLLSLVN